jgi:helicase
VEAEGRELPDAAKTFPEHLRFGAPTMAARVLAANGVRHRRACVILGYEAAVATAAALEGPDGAFRVAGDLLRGDRDLWTGRLGALVVERTLEDVTTGQRS